MDLPSYEEAIKEPVETGRGAKFCRQATLRAGRQATIHFAGENDNTEDMSNCWAIILFISPLAMIVIVLLSHLFFQCEIYIL